MVLQSKDDASFVKLNGAALRSKVVVEFAQAEEADSSCVLVLDQESSANRVTHGLILEHLNHGLASVLKGILFA